MKKVICLFLSLLFCLPAAADEWTLFENGSAPEDGGFLVNDYTGTLTLTFLGDCTLGGEESTAGSSRGFLKTIAREGTGWPFRNLSVLTAADDLSIANLEGVLTDRKLTKVEKEYNFKGPTSFTAILQDGSIECVTLANNHTFDYGEAGYEDTQAALESANVAYFSSERAAIWERDGLKIGFVGVTFSAGKEFDQLVEALWDNGCSAVIVYMHAGQEYEKTPGSSQKAIADRAARLGCTLVIGSHPHVVQGYELRGGIPVVYSLGNCSFGGNSRPSDLDALAVQAVLNFKDGTLVSTELHFYPISVSGEKRYNDYSPILLSGEDAARVLQKMTDSTGTEMPPFVEGEGSVIRVEY